MSIYIFGTGKYGNCLFDFIERNNLCSIDGFVSSSGDKELFRGLTVYSLENIVAKQETIALLIAVNNSDLISYVKRMVIYKDNIIVYDCSDFIRNNLEKESGRYICILCGHRIERFAHMDTCRSNLFNVHHIIGAGSRDNCICPICGCMDRYRWIKYVVDHFSGIAINPYGSMLHFAPEKQLKSYFRYMISRGLYVTADLVPGEGDIAIDMTNIPFKDDTFNCIMANHVLEHIPDEKAAIEELMRVLKKDGCIILSFPIDLSQDTFEDSSITNPEDRERVFGQSDHVRLYGKDFKERFEKYGLKIKTYSPRDYLTDSEIDEMGLIRDDITLICKHQIT